MDASGCLRLSVPGSAPGSLNGFTRGRRQCYRLCVCHCSASRIRR